MNFHAHTWAIRRGRFMAPLGNSKITLRMGTCKLNFTLSFTISQQSHLSCPSPIMNFNDQDRQCCVTLSAAKGLARWPERCFAALSMTGRVLIVKTRFRKP